VLTIAVTIMALVAVYMFVHKVIYKRRMERQLGRKVDEREMTSLTSWMNDTPEKR
jgi:hypothetical protein